MIWNTGWACADGDMIHMNSAKTRNIKSMYVVLDIFGKTVCISMSSNNVQNNTDIQYLY